MDEIKKPKHKKRNIFIVIVLAIIAFVLYFSQGKVYDKKDLEYGLTFSKKQAISLGLDWQLVFLSILDDLGVRKLRIPAYWDEIKPTVDTNYWDDTDWLVYEASKRNADIILAVGGRLPRWPECHWPEWAGKLSDENREVQILGYIKEVVERYKDNKRITAWQVENEPFLAHFGDCPILNKEFLDKEIALVRELDNRPIVLTDSGELSLWVPAAKRADIFGTSIYRDTFSRHLGIYIHYPIGPAFFRFKKNIVSLFANPKKWIVIELQAEPWGPRPYQNLTQAERDRTMNLTKFREILEFSRQAGFQEFYLWGAEWWYWEKQINNNPALWEEAKLLYKQGD